MHAQSIAIPSSAKQWCSLNGLEDAAFLLEISPDSLSPAFYVVWQASVQSGNTVFTIPANVPVLPSSQVRITPSGDENHLSVSSASAQQASYARIQRHIDGTEPFTEVWQWLAADANMDSVITGADITLLQNVNLGIYVEYPFAHGPYRFVPRSYIFPNPATPLIPQPPDYISKKFSDLDSDNAFWYIELGNLLYGPDCLLITGINAPSPFTAVAATPNPTMGSFSIQVNLPKTCKLYTEIFDLTGKCISATPAQMYPSGTATITFAPVAVPGIYIWRVTDADGQYVTGKIMQQ